MGAQRPGALIEVARKELLRQVAIAKRQTWLAAPFLSREIAASLAVISQRSSATDKRLITALNEGAVIGGFLDPAGLRIMGDSGFEVRSIRNLHAKLSLVDDRWGLAGSGNLTTRGLGAGRRGNVELGVLLQKSQIREARRIFERWWRKAEPLSDSDLARYEALAARARKTRGRGRGDGVGPELEIDLEEEIERTRARGGATGFWLKMMYPRLGREAEEWWHEIDWVADGRPARNGRRVGGPRYQVDDLLVVYVTGLGCAAILRVVKPPRYDAAYVKEYGAPGDWKRWPWVTDVDLLWSVPRQRAVPLETIKVASTSVRQQGRIHLSEAQFELAKRRIAS